MLRRGLELAFPISCLRLRPPFPVSARINDCRINRSIKYNAHLKHEKCSFLWLTFLSVWLTPRIEYRVSLCGSKFLMFSKFARWLGHVGWSFIITKVQNVGLWKCHSTRLSSRFPDNFHSWTFSLNHSNVFVGQDEQHEIQRQNRITEQILSSFFERKFFPNRKPKPAPTIDEILPPESRANPSIRDKHSAHRDDDDEPETDNLQSVESEHVDSFYRDYPEGRWNISKVILHIFVGCL